MATARTPPCATPTSCAGCLIEAAGGRRDLASAVDEYEQQMFAYGAEAVRDSLKALPTYASPSR